MALMKFSVLEIDAGDEREKYLTDFLSDFDAETFANGEPLVVPVFGRARALEVLPAAEVTAENVDFLTQYLCGACSCQVKERNPGFDLFVNVDWNTSLFGEGVAAPEISLTSTTPPETPTLMDIPQGQSSDAAETTADSEEKTETLTRQSSMLSLMIVLMVIVVVALVAARRVDI